MQGYYYDPKTKRYEWGNSPEAKATIGEAQTQDAVPTDYASVEDAGELSDGVAAKSNNTAGAAAAGKSVDDSVNKGDNALSTAGGGMMAFGAATANPALVGAGLATSAGGAIMKGKENRRKQQYKAEVERYRQRQAAIQRMAEIGKGLKA